ncbi:MAG: hypothetical protein ABJM19_10245 [Marinobacter sp.]|uniref:hypothetical protein n=1 Tax=unclassified Marinobacter TaxID=83889 RepID=UPI00273CD48A|nr:MULTISPECIES: hypothetical protein [unclassified Marinobacter]MDP4546558.1 hypothetical protein [Marinobacter sp. MDS2]
MEATTIVIILATIVALSLVIIVVSQMREKSRIERLRKIREQQDSYKRADRLLTEIPGQYLNSGLKLILLKQMEDACRNLAALKTDKPVDPWLNTVKQTRQQVVDKTDNHPPVKIDSPEKAQHIKEHLTNLFKLIEGMHKSGRIDAPTAKQNLKYVLFLIHKTHADLHVFQAREHVRQNDIRKAIHSYHSASMEMVKSKDNPLALKAVKSFRTRIKELEASLQDDDMVAEHGTKLDQEWDNMLQDEESWKKRKDFDN